MATDERNKAYRVKKKRKKIGFWTKLVVLIIAGYFTMSFYQQSVERRELEAEIHGLHQEQAEIEARIKGLEEIIRTGDSDEAIEKLARENLTMKKPGEQVYILDTTNTLNQELSDPDKDAEEEANDGENGDDENRENEEDADGEEDGP